MAKVTGKYEGAEKLFENSFIIFGAIIIMLGFMAFIISVQNKIAISKLNSLTEQHSRQINYIEKMQERQLLVDEYDKDECDWYNYAYVNDKLVFTGCSKDDKKLTKKADKVMVEKCKQPKQINIAGNSYIIWNAIAWKYYGTYDEDKYIYNDGSVLIVPQ